MKQQKKSKITNPAKLALLAMAEAGTPKFGEPMKPLEALCAIYRLPLDLPKDAYWLAVTVLCEKGGAYEQDDNLNAGRAAKTDAIIERADQRDFNAAIARGEKPRKMMPSSLRAEYARQDEDNQPNAGAVCNSGEINHAN